MAVRTAFEAVAGAAITSANSNRYPGGWIGYVEVTANQTGITAEVDLTGLSAAVTVGTNRRIKITVNLAPSSTGADEVIVGYIKEGSTQLMARAVNVGQPINNSTTLNFSVILTPTAGAHTYKVAMLRSTTVGSVTSIASSVQPAFLLVEDIGPSA